jgi:methyl-accepting chemotaxis protein
MLGGASDQAHKIESSTAAVTEMSSSIQTVAENAAQATRVAQESGDALARGIKRLNDIESIVQETADKIAALGQSGKRIGNIVEVIRQISEQTSLLALNASIEAAHAGEQGRGFAVVADEVSSLARRVGQSAKDIETLIATISDQTVDAVSSMQRVTREFADQTSGSNALQSALRRIIETVGETARSVQEQAIVSDEIARNMDAVRKIANEVLTSSQEAVVQGEALHELALRLETLVRGFRISSEGGDEADGNGVPKVAGRGAAAALPERSSERRKVARS